MLLRSPCARIPPPLPRWNPRVPSSLASPTIAAFPVLWPGRLPHQPFRGLHGVRCRCSLRARQITYVILYNEGFGRFVSSTTAPIATGWSESCRVGSNPLRDRAFSRRTTFMAHPISARHIPGSSSPCTSSAVSSRGESITRLPFRAAAAGNHIPSVLIRSLAEYIMSIHLYLRAHDRIFAVHRAGMACNAAQLTRHL